MSLSTSPEERTATPETRLPAPSSAAPTYARPIAVLGIVVTGVLTLYGAWERRWIADDGLIVLRTVRNLLAGNGPVFNRGERVETNTSAAWTYVVWFFGRISGIQLEYVVLTIGLVLTTAAVVIAMIATGRLHRGRPAVLVPAGAIVYISLSPARDFASSGLETCLVLFWLAVLWWLMVRWAYADRSAPVLLVAFWAGLSPLVRPELVLVGGLMLVMMFVGTRGLLRKALLVVVAGVLPLGYQVWRMGYYGLPYPNTAVSKDAGGSKWGQGLAYLGNLIEPYRLWVPFAIGAVVAVATAVSLARRGGFSRWLPRSDRDVRALVVRGVRTSPEWVRSPAAVVVAMVVSGVLSVVYTTRVGGDFMHGRTLLPGLFMLLLPVSVVPLPIRRATAFVPAVLAWAGLMAWAAVAASTPGMPGGTALGRSGIVDERAFYSLNTGHEHPILASDYLDYPRMRAMVQAIEDTPDGGLLLNTPQFTYWDVVPPPAPIPPGGAEHIVYFLNLGMTSMNVGLDVRVLDQMGLAYPLAAHTVRLENGRIGHDKALFADWVVADTGMVQVHPFLPAFMDEDWVARAKLALTCPQTVQLLDSYRAELTRDRFIENVKNSLEIAAYRFDRVPEYALEECSIPVPPEKSR